MTPLPEHRSNSVLLQEEKLVEYRSPRQIILDKDAFPMMPLLPPTSHLHSREESASRMFESISHDQRRMKDESRQRRSN